MKTNRKSVSASLWVPIPAVFIFMILTGLIMNATHFDHIEIMEVIFSSFAMLVVGMVVWIPSMLICLLIEYLAIKEPIGQQRLVLILAVEAFIPFVIFNLLTGGGDQFLLGSSFLIAYAAQAVRWGYLTRKMKKAITKMGENVEEE